MIPSTVACLVSSAILRCNKNSERPPRRAGGTGSAARGKNLLTNCQAQDNLAYRFPLLRATSRNAAHRPTRRNGRRRTDRELRVRRYRADTVHGVLRPEGISWMAYP